MASFFDAFKDISKFSNTSDYLPILTGAIITDLIVLLRTSLGQIKSKALHSWYHKYGIAGVLADVLSITIGVLIVRFLYPFVFSGFSIFKMAGLAVIVQFIHDVLFYKLFQNIPRGRSQILDTFKDYASELGGVILLADAAMMVSTVLIASLLAGYSWNMNIAIFIIVLYLVPYFLYSI